jgi:hypothetical protein
VAGQPGSKPGRRPLRALRITSLSEKAVPKVARPSRDSVPSLSALLPGGSSHFATISSNDHRSGIVGIGGQGSLP